MLYRVACLFVFAAVATILLDACRRDFGSVSPFSAKTAWLWRWLHTPWVRPLHGRYEFRQYVGPSLVWPPRLYYPTQKGQTSCADVTSHCSCENPAARDSSAYRESVSSLYTSVYAGPLTSPSTSAEAKIQRDGIWLQRFLPHRSQQRIVQYAHSQRAPRMDASLQSSWVRVNEGLLRKYGAISTASEQENRSAVSGTSTQFFNQSSKITKKESDLRRTYHALFEVMTQLFFLSEKNQIQLALSSGSLLSLYRHATFRYGEDVDLYVPIAQTGRLRRALDDARLDTDSVLTWSGKLDPRFPSEGSPGMLKVYHKNDVCALDGAEHVVVQIFEQIDLLWTIDRWFYFPALWLSASQRTLTWSFLSEWGTFILAPKNVVDAQRVLVLNVVPPSDDVKPSDVKLYGLPLLVRAGSPALATAEYGDWRTCCGNQRCALAEKKGNVRLPIVKSTSFTLEKFLQLLGDSYTSASNESAVLHAVLRNSLKLNSLVHLDWALDTRTGDVIQFSASTAGAFGQGSVTLFSTTDGRALPLYLKGIYEAEWFWHRPLYGVDDFDMGGANFEQAVVGTNTDCAKRGVSAYPTWALEGLVGKKHRCLLVIFAALAGFASAVGWLFHAACMSRVCRSDVRYAFVSTAV